MVKVAEVDRQSGELITLLQWAAGHSHLTELTEAIEIVDETANSNGERVLLIGSNKNKFIGKLTFKSDKSTLVQSVTNQRPTTVNRRGPR
ncbi:MAG: hypothetical protein O7C56_03775 [Rickettsia endosymbiont of Ixodes persulcatus]|nr:hypothetical protein [Rickettsia endosymbiont of Ixodes persulcatus]